MTYIIRCEGWADGRPCDVLGKYIESFQHHTSDGRGLGTFTPDPRRAMQFATAPEAMAFWKMQSITRPLRSDGKPNRPMTAWHASILPMENA